MSVSEMERTLRRKDTSKMLFVYIKTKQEEINLISAENTITTKKNVFHFLDIKSCMGLESIKHEKLHRNYNEKQHKFLVGFLFVVVSVLSSLM